MRIGSTDRRPSQQRSTERTILFTSAGSSDPLRLRTCIWEELTGTRNDTTGCAALTRTGVAMNAFSAKDTRGGDEMERSRKTPHHRQPPLGGSLDIHAGFGVVTGRSSDLQAWPIKNDPCFYLPIFPVLHKTHNHSVFDPSYPSPPLPHS